MAGQPTSRRAAVIGASGYIGTHLVPRLVSEGWQVTASSRNTDVLAAREWQDVDLVQADILDEASLSRAVAGADVVFYLVHCMAAGGNFAALERQGAMNLVAAADAAGVSRIVYLGGLSPEHPKSQHLQARLETGRVLREARCTVVELQAGMIVGPGSAAWEVIRDLVNYLPIMITPRWVLSKSMPIALENLLVYLVGAATVTLEGSPVFQVAGPDVCTYENMMRTYGELVGKKPRIIHAPVLTPRLSSYWLRLVTSVPTRIAAALIEGLEHDYIADDAPIRALIPQRLLNFREAAEDALLVEKQHAVATRWVEGSMACRDWNPQYSFYAMKTGDTAASPAGVDATWQVLMTVGCKGDFFYARTLWFLRRLADWFVGGPAMRRKRRHPSELRVGDAFDGWRVIGVAPYERISMLMEMRAPGSGVLELVILNDSEGCRVRATAYWHPAGVWGLLYWWAMLPFHGILFRGMTRSIARRAERLRHAPTGVSSR